MLCVIGARVAVACVAVACGSRGRLLRSDARKQERDDDDALDRDLHTGGPSNPRGSPAGLAAGGYSVPGIGGSLGGLSDARNAEDELRGNNVLFTRFTRARRPSARVHRRTTSC